MSKMKAQAWQVSAAGGGGTTVHQDRVNTLISSAVSGSWANAHSFSDLEKYSVSPRRN